MNNFPTSVKRFIRNEKAKIRREIFDVKKQEELITELYKRFVKGAVQAVAVKVPEKKKEEVKKVEKPKRVNTRKPRPAAVGKDKK